MVVVMVGVVVGVVVAVAVAVVVAVGVGVRVAVVVGVVVAVAVGVVVAVGVGVRVAVVVGVVVAVAVAVAVGVGVRVAVVVAVAVVVGVGVGVAVRVGVRVAVVVMVVVMVGVRVRVGINKFMIKSILLQHFQSHKNSLLEFAPGVNAIVGASDAGKTAVLRALAWVATNRPAGDAFRSVWGGDTRVEINTEDLIIYRVKGNKDNYYQIQDHIDDSVTFKAMGQGVPEPIAKALNLTDINMQRQMDAPFLLSASASEVAQTLNEVVGLDDIDRAISSINRTVTQARQDIEREQTLLREAQIELEQYVELDGIDFALSAIESLKTQADRQRSKEADINRLIVSIAEAQAMIDELSPITSLLPECGRFTALDDKANTLDKRITTLNDLITSTESFTKAIAASVYTDSIGEKFNRLFDMNTTAEQMFQDNNTIEKLLASIDKMESEIKDGANSILNMQTRYKTSMPEECPLCGARTK